MPAATYTLELMLSHNTWSDVTADWRMDVPLIVERGIEPGQRVAGVGRMSCALHNPDGRYTPGHANATSGVEVGVRVRLRASDGTNSYPLFTGRIAALTPQADGSHRDALHITAVDDMAAYQRQRLALFPLQVDAQPGTLVERLLARAAIPIGRLALWHMGLPHMAALGGGTTLGSTASGVDIDSGQSALPWAGDTWPEGQRTRSALRDVCASEGGFFYVAADGTPTFNDRHTRPRQFTADGSLSTGLAGASAAHLSEQIVNHVEVIVHPRVVGTAGEVLWQAGHNILLRGDEGRTITCRYSDPDQEAASVAAQTVLAPLPGVDFTASTAADGSGADATAFVSVSLEAGARSARVTLRSRWPAPETIYVHDLQVRGTPLRASYPAVIRVENAHSHYAHGRQAISVDMPLQSDPAVGEDMARALLANRAEARPWLAIRVEATASATLLTQALARDVGDRLHISAEDLALDAAPCFVEHVRHEVQGGGARHRVTWRTSPAGVESYLVLGSAAQAALGETSKLGY